MNWSEINCAFSVLTQTNEKIMHFVSKVMPFESYIVSYSYKILHNRLVWTTKVSFNYDIVRDTRGYMYLFRSKDTGNIKNIFMWNLFAHCNFKCGSRNWSSTIISINCTYQSNLAFGSWAIASAWTRLPPHSQPLYYGLNYIFNRIS